ncbi:acetamidase/formamidase family protein [Clostridium magnum]|uniref:Formamidase n=1 Tax=Clostridium magnum DSM 2767 TaxID=1121326 RepID=A0A161YFY4_9CLOT|nr:acetamidase/formamidase family protein [Clostridium magnum]KZL89022.1 formamidase [Clostridium magnum DSM 2767]SHI23225.1 amidase [Clostridium magnum DSM 2767]
MLHKVGNENVIYKFSKKNHSVLSVNSGDEVEFETLDCFAGQIKEDNYEIEGLDWDRINPATGPVYVNGAEKGDALKVTIIKIEVKGTAVIATGKDMGVLQSEFGKSYVKVAKIEEDRLIFNKAVKIPIKPMIGVIGVAPESGEISCGAPDSHGGNMDNNMINEGAMIYFPVATEGALFALGDVHAVMGDGEIGVTGAEVSAKVTVKLEVVKGLKIGNPMLENDEYLSTIAASEDLDEAVEISISDMFYILRGKTEIKDEEVVMLFSLVGKTEICQIVDPKKTARFVMPKSMLKSIGYLGL